MESATIGYVYLHIGSFYNFALWAKCLMQVLQPGHHILVYTCCIRDIDMISLWSGNAIEVEFEYVF